MKVLLAEDEKKVRDFIKQALEQAGMVVDTATNQSDLLAFLSTSSFDVLVLDRLLGSWDSLSALSEIRKQYPPLKVLVLSALGEINDRVAGLTEGADDYLPKPFHVSELVARLRTLARRTGSEKQSGKDTILTYEDLKIDLEAQKAYRGTKRIDVTKKEFQILSLLARHPGMVFSKASILNQVWDMNHFPESNVIEVTIANLRSKVDKTFKPLIQSQRGVGYWLGEP